MFSRWKPCRPSPESGPPSQTWCISRGISSVSGSGTGGRGAHRARCTGDRCELTTERGSAISASGAISACVGLPCGRAMSSDRNMLMMRSAGRLE
ncbi:hypothetical protein GCM10020366_71960 [Saccharopolyspora gregorii]|uniref:Uncharacterized protein n=1 Tax=Saccharopolyspora gregorii TaxID=33914 RepID=A0ABP6S3D4_9PSEU